MAIIHERKVQRVEVYGNKQIMVVYEYKFDDTEDAELPVTTQKVIHLEPLTIDYSDPENVIKTPTDVSSHDPLVQTICAAVWGE